SGGDRHLAARRGRIDQVADGQDDRAAAGSGDRGDLRGGKLQELENRKVTVEKDLHEKEQELVRGRAVTNVQDVQDLVDRIKDTSSGDSYRLRSMIAARLRSIVDTIFVAPAGDAPRTEKTIALLREQPDTNIIIKEMEKTADTRRYFAAVL